MADEEAPGNGGAVHDVNAQEIQNICRLMIDVGDGSGRTAEILFEGKLILHNSGHPTAAAAAGDAAPGNAGQGQSAADAEDKEFLMQMRGWLMTVATLFVTMAFQAALQPPDWLRTADFLRFNQTEKHRFHGASHAAVAPARFAPSPSPSRQAAESATAGPSVRAWAYMICNYFTFGTSLMLVLVLMFLRNKPFQAERIMGLAKVMMVQISFFVVGTVVLGTSEDWLFMVCAVVMILGWAFAPLCVSLRVARRAREP